MQWATDCVGTVREMNEKITKAERELDRLRNERHVPPIKTPEEWVEDHYQSLLTKKNKSPSESEYSELAAEFRELEGYNEKIAKFVNECDIKHRELKAQREEQERIAKIEKDRKDAEEQERRRIAEAEAEAKRQQDEIKAFLWPFQKGQPDSIGCFSGCGCLIGFAIAGNILASSIAWSKNGVTGITLMIICCFLGMWVGTNIGRFFLK